ncbi:MAG TPA: BamA/TamA family outer membrane protein [Anaeromyxobacteraceae bacterium]|nr:BamA/TamA family outer membrane protein [Anaeromyxobacteraceae bacterium]
MSQTAAAVAEKRPPSWFAVPVLFWLPETKLGIAAAGGFHFHLDGSPSPSNVLAVAGYTLEKQGTVDVTSDVYLRGGTLLTGRLRIVHYPDWYYGIGPETTETGRASYTRRYAELIAQAELPIAGTRLRAGPRLVAHGEEIWDARPDGSLATSGLPGVNGYRSLGFGASVTWDTRDRPLYPARGTFAQAYYVRHPEAVAGPGFGKGTLDLRLFRPLPRETVLGLGFVVETSDGDVPVLQYPKLGSARYLRGYRDGRYRDRLSWAGQAELRVPLHARLSGTVFGGLGDVAPDVTALDLDTVKVAAGLGLRYRLTDEGVNLRLDVAASDAGVEVYVVLLEAF